MGSQRENLAYDYRLMPEGARLSERIKKLFVKKNEEAEINNNTLSSNPVYLPAGTYNLELFLENLKLYKTFYLNPRIIQKQSVDTYDGRILQFDLQETSSKPVQIIPRVYDGITGESLYKIADISMYLKDRDIWIDWKKYIRDKRLQRYLLTKLYSGKEYTFRFRAPTYYPETVTFYVENDLDLARIEAGLIKIPGKLIVESDYEGLTLLIDNRRENYLGGKQKEFISFRKTSLERRILISENS